MKKLMYKVHTQTGEHVLFDNKEDAKQYIELLNSVGKSASLNKWQWQVEIED